jgi:hypothetical protein
MKDYSIKEYNDTYNTPKVGDRVIHISKKLVYTKDNNLTVTEKTEKTRGIITNIEAFSSINESAYGRHPGTEVTISWLEEERLYQLKYSYTKLVRDKIIVKYVPLSEDPQENLMFSRYLSIAEGNES